MGAAQFSSTVEGGPGDMKKAFNAAVEQAQYDYGHAGYTGTIAEKTNVVKVGEAKTGKEAAQLAEELFDKRDDRIDDKWGPAGAIFVSEPVTPKGEKRPPYWLFFGWASE